MSHSSKPSFDSQPYTDEEKYIIAWFDIQVDQKDSLIATAKRIYQHKYCEDRYTAFDAAARILLDREV